MMALRAPGDCLSCIIALNGAKTPNISTSIRWNDLMNLRELCFHLRERRRMYLLDDRFSTAVAFVEGYNTALDGVPLSGFQEYVAQRVLHGRSSRHWAYLIASTKVPGIDDGTLRIDHIAPEWDGELTEMAIDLLEGFAAQTTGPAASA